MHGGILMVVRRYLIHAKPWQQALICVLLVAVGLVLVTSGLLVGGVLAIGGVLFGWQALSVRRALRGSLVQSDAERPAARSPND